MYKHWKFGFIVLILFLMISSVWAQEPEITPTPRPSTSTVITEVSDAVQTNSNALGILVLVVIILGAIVVIFLIVAWKGLQPLIKALTNANEERNKLQEKVFEMITTQAEREVVINQTRQMQSKSLEETAKQQEATVRLMAEIETKNEAQAGRTQIISSINEHTSKNVDALNETLKIAVTELAQVKSELESNLKKSDLEDGIRLVLEKITQVANEVSELRTMLTPKPVQPVEVTNPIVPVKVVNDEEEKSL